MARDKKTSEKPRLQVILGKLDLQHIRLRAAKDQILFESGPVRDPDIHARFTRQRPSLWRLSVPTFCGDWEETPHFGKCEDLLYLLIQSYGWLLSKRERMTTNLS